MSIQLSRRDFMKCSAVAVLAAVWHPAHWLQWWSWGWLHRSKHHDHHFGRSFCKDEHFQ